MVVPISKGCVNASFFPHTVSHGLFCKHKCVSYKRLKDGVKNNKLPLECRCVDFHSEPSAQSQYSNSPPITEPIDTAVPRSVCAQLAPPNADVPAIVRSVFAPSAACIIQC